MTAEEARLRHARTRMHLAEERFERVKDVVTADELNSLLTELNDAQLELDLAEIAASAPSPRR